MKEPCANTDPTVQGCRLEPQTSTNNVHVPLHWNLTQTYLFGHDSDLQQSVGNIIDLGMSTSDGCPLGTMTQSLPADTYLITPIRPSDSGVFPCLNRYDIQEEFGAGIGQPNTACDLLFEGLPITDYWATGDKPGENDKHSASSRCPYQSKWSGQDATNFGLVKHAKNTGSHEGDDTLEASSTLPAFPACQPQGGQLEAPYSSFMRSQPLDLGFMHPLSRDDYAEDTVQLYGELDSIWCSPVSVSIYRNDSVTIAEFSEESPHRENNIVHRELGTPSSIRPNTEERCTSNGTPVKTSETMTQSDKFSDNMTLSAEMDAMRRQQSNDTGSSGLPVIDMRSQIEDPPGMSGGVDEAGAEAREHFQTEISSTDSVNENVNNVSQTTDESCSPRSPSYACASSIDDAHETPTNSSDDTSCIGKDAQTILNQKSLKSDMKEKGTIAIATQVSSACIQCDIQSGGVGSTLGDDDENIPCNKASRQESGSSDKVFNSVEIGKSEILTARIKSLKAEGHWEEIVLEEHADKYTREPVSGCRTTAQTMLACSVCSSYKTAVPVAMETHLELHVNGILDCNKCDFVAGCPRQLQAHKARSHTDTTFICEYCGKRFVQKSYFRRHLARVHGHLSDNNCDKPVVMATKDIVMPTKITVRPTKSKRTGMKRRKACVKISSEETNACKDCGRSFKSKSGLGRHSLSAACLKPTTELPCAQCGKAFSSAPLLRRHVQQVHLKERFHKCHKCPFTSQSASRLSTHVNSKHSDFKAFECEVCFYATARRDHLRTHMRVHTEDRPYTCEQCSYTTPWAAMLKKHKALHSSRDTVTCPDCGTVTRDIKALKLHCTRLHGYLPELCKKETKRKR